MENENKNNQMGESEGNFALPEGYFKKSGATIFNKIEWEEEHKNYTQLERLKNQLSFTIPENYFLRKEVQLEQLEYTKLNALKKETGFSVPEDYFEQAEHICLTKFAKDSAEELPSFSNLNAIQKQNNFNITEDYFATNKKRLTDLLQKKKPAQTIYVYRKRMVYAMAASVLVVLSVWSYAYYFAPLEIKDCGTIACVDRIDLVKTKNLESLDNDELYELVNPKDLEEKLELTKEVNKPSIKNDTNLNDVSTDDLLDEI